MFGLGTADRFFLASAVEAATLAQYTLAGKLAFAAPLLLQPFALWWNPRRIGVLAEPDGLARSARVVSYGFVILFASGILVILAASLFIELAMPQSFHAAIQFLPWVVLITGLNEIATLVNVGSFARPHGREILFINGLGGLTAVLFYLLLVSSHGVYGAIAATILGHGLRIGLFLWLGRSLAPIPYPVFALLILFASCVALVLLRPGSQMIMLQIGFALLAIGIVLIEAQFLGLLPKLQSWKGRLLSSNPPA